MDGPKLLQNTSVIPAFTHKPLPKFNSDSDHSSIDYPGNSSSPPLGAVGSSIGRVDLRHSDAAPAIGGHLPGRVERWLGWAMAVCIHANCLERASADALDIGADGGYQCGDGNVDRLCPGTL